MLIWLLTVMGPIGKPGANACGGGGSDGGGGGEVGTVNGGNGIGTGGGGEVGDLGFCGAGGEDLGRPCHQGFGEEGTDGG